MRAREFITEDDYVYHGTAQALVPFIQHSGFEPEASSDGLTWFAKDPAEAQRYSEAHKHQFAGPKRQGAVLRVHKRHLPTDALQHLTYSDVTATSQPIPPKHIEHQQPDGSWAALAALAEALTPQHIHDLADRLGIAWDDDLDFLRMTKRVTGKAHLDDLDQEGLRKMQDHLERKTLREGGWDTTITQGTIIRPAVVKQVLGQVQKFVEDFNRYLGVKGLGPVEIGRPTGSSAYHERDQRDDPDKVYGDIDLQMIAPPVEGLSYGQYTSYWNKLADEFVKAQHPDYVHDAESKPGHPIFRIGENDWVQVDFMWHTPELRQWGAARVTPEHGVKGLLTGNMYSVLGELLGMSIQHAGVQYKTVGDEPVSFSKQKDTTVHTITIKPESFIYDIFLDLYRRITGERRITKDRIDPLLLSNRGVNTADVRIRDLVSGIKGLARSFELNDMYGRSVLQGFSSAGDFLDQFLRRYEEKAMADVTAKKREKAETPEARARADADRQKVLGGLEMVKRLFK